MRRPLFFLAIASGCANSPPSSVELEAPVRAPSSAAESAPGSALPSVSATPASARNPDRPADDAERASTAPQPIARCPSPVSPTRELIDRGASAHPYFARTNPIEAGIDGAALDRLIAGAEAANSDTLLVLRDGRVVVSRTWGQGGPIETRSITKGIVTLGVLALLSDGKIGSLDEPLSTFFPEFAVGPKSAITLRHVLSHTTGLRHGKTDANDLNAAGDRTRYARNLEVLTPPGTVFSYSNEGSQLLSGIVAHAANMPADQWLSERLFTPLGISAPDWKRDRAGNVQTYYGLSLSAGDLARIGLFIQDRGRVGERELIAARWMDELFTPSEKYPGYGLSFWLDPPVLHRSEKTLPGFELSSLAPLSNRPFTSSEAYFFEARPLLSPPVFESLRSRHRERRGHLEFAPGQAEALIALGGLGQRLEVHPSDRLVVVRQHRRRPGDDQREAKVTFRAMQHLVYALPCRALR